METVRLYDPETKSITTIPASELASNVVRCRIVGIDGDVWADPTKFEDGPLRHGPFPEDVRERIRAIQAVFSEVAPKTFEEWEDGFRRDTHPDREINIWLCMGQAYLHFTDGRDLDLEQKRDIFAVVLACINNGPDLAAQTVSVRTLSRKRIQQIADWVRRKQQAG
jgi:hypothetical protein